MAISERFSFISVSPDLCYSCYDKGLVEIKCLAASIGKNNYFWQLFSMYGHAEWFSLFEKVIPMLHSSSRSSGCYEYWILLFFFFFFFFKALSISGSMLIKNLGIPCCRSCIAFGGNIWCQKSLRNH